MSIRRCPYCKAIIEEGEEYCSNCGTQLLFPDDENIEEEIPGEKILDDEQDQKESPIAEEEVENEVEDGEKDLSPAKKKKLSKKKKPDPPETDKEVDMEDPEKSLLEEEDVFTDELDEDQDEEEWDLDEIEKEDSVKLDERDAPYKDTAGEEDSGESVERKNIEEDEWSELEGKEPEPTDPAGYLDSAELEKQEIDKFITAIKKDRGEDPEPLTPQNLDESSLDEFETEPQPIVDNSQVSDEPSQEEEVEEESLPPDTSLGEMIQEESLREESEPQKESGSSLSVSPSEELFKKEDIRVSTDSLPPWASKIKDDLTPEVLLTEEEEESPPLEEEEEPQIQEDAVFDESFHADTGVGLPEGVSQQNLPFSGDRSEEKLDIRKKKPFHLSTWFKSRLFDIVIMAAVWLITVWIASSVMDVGLFRLIGASALLLGIFFAILLAGYFFLFFFFLGETLGDYVFNEREKSESRHPA
jgi:hypothetical protein